MLFEMFAALSNINNEAYRSNKSNAGREPPKDYVLSFLFPRTWEDCAKFIRKNTLFKFRRIN